MRKIFDNPRAAAALVFALAIAPVQASSLEAIKQSGQLRVTVRRDDKPWSWRENGEMKGIDVDIGAALARRLGVHVDYLDLRADADVNDDLGHGVWLGPFPGDVMLHAPLDRRIEASNQAIKLVAPYHVEGLAMAVDPAKADSARDFALFETEKVAVDIGSLPDVILLSARDHKLIDRVVHFRDVAQAAEAYQRGQVAAFYGEATTVEHLAHMISRPSSVIHPLYVLPSEWTICAVVGADAPELGQAVEQGVVEMQRSGEMQRIFATYGVVWRPPTEVLSLPHPPAIQTAN
jgi:ABC-type amino acid transport substrate-binding protein